MKNYREILKKQKELIVKQKSQLNSLKQILALMPGHVYWIDKDGVCCGCNQNLADLMGTDSINDLLGKSPYLSMPKEIAVATRLNDQEVINNQKEFLSEETGLDKNGNPAVYLTKKTPLYDENGNVNGLLGISLDITDRKKAETLEKEQQLSQQKIANLQVLAGIIAHELRTPLGAINLNCDLIEILLSEILDTIVAINPRLYTGKIADNLAKTFKCTEQINHVIKKTSVTINLLLNNINEKEIDKNTFIKQSIKDAIEQVLQSYPFTDNEFKKIHFTEQHDFNYLGNLDLTKLLLTNLLKNSLYHISLKNSGNIYIRLRSDQDKNYLIFHDTGSGISQKFLPKIFDRFSSKRPGGTGLGLTFCKMIMQAMGGDISCDSKEGEYTTFTLTFPII